ncbi:hypothetical protein PMI09_00813 [Rhizobium sp. CF122]|uniref:hypothetical protein n=1 Tax=Rhizobium sp. CF122 TaxID=1144312 RepID=UPI000271B9E1|nr:hypothetical protein [Rhizobium sp. CF122]EJL57838.1 hypothetical protein PMI09_00813 [Rhizobium sp. CF122]
MIQFDNITHDERKKVAEEAAPLLLQLQGPNLGGPGATMVLGTSMTEVMITPQWVAAEGLGGESGEQSLLQSTGQTISIVETRANNGTAVGYVRHATGTGRDNTAVQITAVSGSVIAGRIRDGLEWIKANVQGEPTVRVLTAPAYQLTALGLYAGDELTGILTVTPMTGGLPIANEQVLTPAEFRQRLRTFAPIQGLEP